MGGHVESVNCYTANFGTKTRILCYEVIGAGFHPDDLLTFINAVGPSPVLAREFSHLVSRSHAHAPPLRSPNENEKYLPYPEFKKESREYINPPTLRLLYENEVALEDPMDSVDSRAKFQEHISFSLGKNEWKPILKDYFNQLQSHFRKKGATFVDTDGQKVKNPYTSESHQKLNTKENQLSWPRMPFPLSHIPAAKKKGRPYAKKGSISCPGGITDENSHWNNNSSINNNSNQENYLFFGRPESFYLDSPTDEYTSSSSCSSPEDDFNNPDTSGDHTIKQLPTPPPNLVKPKTKGRPKILTANKKPENFSKNKANSLSKKHNGGNAEHHPILNKSTRPSNSSGFNSDDSTVSSTSDCENEEEDSFNDNPLDEPELHLNRLSYSLDSQDRPLRRTNLEALCTHRILASAKSAKRPLHFAPGNLPSSAPQPISLRTIIPSLAYKAILVSVRRCSTHFATMSIACMSPTPPPTCPLTGIPVPPLITFLLGSEPSDEATYANASFLNDDQVTMRQKLCIKYIIEESPIDWPALAGILANIDKRLDRSHWGYSILEILKKFRRSEEDGFYPFGCLPPILRKNEAITFILTSPKRTLFNNIQNTLTKCNSIMHSIQKELTRVPPPKFDAIPTNENEKQLQADYHKYILAKQLMLSFSAPLSPLHPTLLPPNHFSTCNPSQFMHQIINSGYFPIHPLVDLSSFLPSQIALDMPFKTSKLNFLSVPLRPSSANSCFHAVEQMTKEVSLPHPYTLDPTEEIFQNSYCHPFVTHFSVGILFYANGRLISRQAPISIGDSPTVMLSAIICLPDHLAFPIGKGLGIHADYPIPLSLQTFFQLVTHRLNLIAKSLVHESQMGNALLHPLNYFAENLCLSTSGTHFLKKFTASCMKSYISGAIKQGALRIDMLKNDSISNKQDLPQSSKNTTGNPCSLKGTKHENESNILSTLFTPGISNFDLKIPSTASEIGLMDFCSKIDPMVGFEPLSSSSSPSFDPLFYLSRLPSHASPLSSQLLSMSQEQIDNMRCELVSTDPVQNTKYETLNTALLKSITNSNVSTTACQNPSSTDNFTDNEKTKELFPQLPVQESEPTKNQLTHHENTHSSPCELSSSSVAFLYPAQPSTSLNSSSLSAVLSSKGPFMAKPASSNPPSAVNLAQVLNHPWRPLPSVSPGILLNNSLNHAHQASIVKAAHLPQQKPHDSHMSLLIEQQIKSSSGLLSTPTPKNASFDKKTTESVSNSSTSEHKAVRRSLQDISKASTDNISSTLQSSCSASHVNLNTDPNFPSKKAKHNSNEILCPSVISSASPPVHFDATTLKLSYNISPSSPSSVSPNSSLVPAPPNSSPIQPASNTDEILSLQNNMLEKASKSTSFVEQLPQSQASHKSANVDTQVNDILPVSHSVPSKQTSNQKSTESLQRKMPTLVEGSKKLPDANFFFSILKNNSILSQPSNIVSNVEKVNATDISVVDASRKPDDKLQPSFSTPLLQFLNTENDNNKNSSNSQIRISTPAITSIQQPANKRIATIRGLSSSPDIDYLKNFFQNFKSSLPDKSSSTTVSTILKSSNPDTLKSMNDNEAFFSDGGFSIDQSIYTYKQNMNSKSSSWSSLRRKIFILKSLSEFTSDIYVYDPIDNFKKCSMAVVKRVIYSARFHNMSSERLGLLKLFLKRNLMVSVKNPNDEEHDLSWILCVMRKIQRGLGVVVTDDNLDLFFPKTMKTLRNKVRIDKMLSEEERNQIANKVYIKMVKQIRKKVNSSFLEIEHFNDEDQNANGSESDASDLSSI